MADLFTRLKQIAAKIEAVKGTAETLAAADATMLISEPTYTPDIPMNEREMITTSFDRFPALPGTQAAAIALKTEVKGGGAAGTAPALGTFLQAAGFGETVNVGVSVEYDPVSTGVKTLTAAEYVIPETGNALKMALAGGMCRTFRFTGTVGEALMAEMEIYGKYTAAVDVTKLAPTLEVLAPPVILGATFTMHGDTLQIRSLTIDLGLQMALKSDITEATGWAFGLVTGKQPTISMDCQADLIANHDFLGKLQAGTEGALNLVIGATPGNIITITGPKIQYTSISEGDRDGLAVFNVEGRFNKGATDDTEMQIVFT